MMIDDLRREGAKVAAGEFLLDEARAREMLAQFQLVDPRRYVLEFVKAAHLLGATRVEFQMDTDELEVRFDGELVSGEEFDGLASAVFGRRVTAKQRALRHLAIGQNAAQNLRLREFSFSVIEGGPRPIMRIYLRERVRPTHLFLFATSLLNKRLPEASILGAHCALATLPIFVNGERISHGPTFAGEYIARTEIADALGGGVAWLDPRPEEGVVHIAALYHGVLVGRHTLSSPMGDAHVVFETSGLTLNLSQSEIVQDEFWTDVVERIVPNALLKCLIAYFGEMSRDYATRHRRKLFELVVNVVNLFPLETSQPEPTGRTFEAFLEVASGLPIFEIANPTDEEREGKRLVSIRELSWTNPETGRTRLYIAQRTFPGVELKDRARALVYTPTARHQGHAFMSFAKEVFDATDLLEQEQGRQENQRKWKPWKGLDEEVFSHRFKGRFEGLEVSVALTPGQESSNWAKSHIVSGDLVIAEVTWPFALVGGLVVVIAGTLEVNAGWNGPAITETYGGAVAMVCELIPALCLRFKKWASLDEQQAFILACLDLKTGEPLEALLHYHEKDGLICAALRRGVLRALTDQMEQWTAEQVAASREGLHRLLGNIVGRVQALPGPTTTEDLASQEAFLEAVAKLSIFKVANPTNASEKGVDVSIDALRWRPAGNARSRLYISSQRFDVSHAKQIELQDGGRVLFHGREWGEGGELFRLFVDDLYDARPLLSARLSAAANRKRWTERPIWSKSEFETVHAPCFVSVAGPLTVSVGMGRRGDDKQAITFVKEGRLLSESATHIPALPGFTILFEGELDTNHDFNGPAMSETYRGALSAAMELLGQVVLRRLEELRGSPKNRQAFLQRVFTEATTERVYEALRVEKHSREGLEGVGDGVVKATIRRLNDYSARGVREQAWTIRQLIFDLVVVLGIDRRDVPIPRLVRGFLDVAVTLHLFYRSNHRLTQRGSYGQEMLSIEELRWVQGESGRSQLYISPRRFLGVVLGQDLPVLCYDESLGEHGSMFMPFADDVFDATHIMEKRANPFRTSQLSLATDPVVARGDSAAELRLSALLQRQLAEAGVLAADFEIVYESRGEGRVCQVRGRTIELNRTHPALVHGLTEGEDEVAAAFLTSMIISHLMLSLGPQSMPAEANGMRIGLIAYLSGVLDEQ